MVVDLCNDPLAPRRDLIRSVPLSGRRMPPIEFLDATGSAGCLQFRIHFNCRVSVAYVAAKVGPYGDRRVLEGQDLLGGRRGMTCVSGT